jgi:hypothetical protein
MPLPSERASLVREGVLALGFVLLVIAAAVTVALPELRQKPEPATSPPGEPASSVPQR